MSAPPGQRYRDDFPRFGLDQFANRVVEHVGEWSVAVGGDVAEPLLWASSTVRKSRDALDSRR